MIAFPVNWFVNIIVLASGSSLGSSLACPLVLSSWFSPRRRVRRHGLSTSAAGLHHLYSILFLGRHCRRVLCSGTFLLFHYTHTVATLSGPQIRVRVSKPTANTALWLACIQLAWVCCWLGGDLTVPYGQIMRHGALGAKHVTWSYFLCPEEFPKRQVDRL